MTDNQEKELFNTLATLVTGVNAIQLDIKDIKETQNEHTRILDKHSQILDKHSQILDKHSQILDKHSQILDKHSQILNRLDAKTDSIAETVMTNDKRLIVVEKDVADLRERIH